MAILDARDLRKVYGENVAVAGVTFAVEAGQVFGFLGPNGAGKTTTIKMLLGLTRPTAGQARLLDRPPGDHDAMAKVGFLPEHFSFPRWLTARELLDVHGRLLGLPAGDRKARVELLLERVGLGPRGEGRIGNFSKGMMQRIGLAQALMGRPEVVFLDEPTSGLDPVGRRDVRDIIRELRAEGTTVFLNSHLLSEVEITCDRVLIVKAGRVVRSGTMADLTGGRREVSLRVAGLEAATLAGLADVAEVLSVAAGHLVLAVADEERLPDVVARLVAAGARIYEVTPRRPSLEEIFLRVIEEEPA